MFECGFMNVCLTTKLMVSSRHCLLGMYERSMWSNQFQLLCLLIKIIGKPNWKEWLACIFALQTISLNIQQITHLNRVHRISKNIIISRVFKSLHPIFVQVFSLWVISMAINMLTVFTESLLSDPFDWRKLPLFKGAKTKSV